MPRKCILMRSRPNGRRFASFSKLFTRTVNAGSIGGSPKSDRPVRCRASVHSPSPFRNNALRLRLLPSAARNRRFVGSGCCVSLFVFIGVALQEVTQSSDGNCAFGYSFVPVSPFTILHPPCHATTMSPVGRVERVLFPFQMLRRKRPYKINRELDLEVNGLLSPEYAVGAGAQRFAPDWIFIYKEPNSRAGRSARRLKNQLPTASPAKNALTAVRTAWTSAPRTATVL